MTLLSFPPGKTSVLASTFPLKQTNKQTTLQVFYIPHHAKKDLGKGLDSQNKTKNSNKKGKNRKAVKEDPIPDGVDKVGRQGRQR